MLVSNRFLLTPLVTRFSLLLNMSQTFQDLRSLWYVSKYSVKRSRGQLVDPSVCRPDLEC